MSEKKKLGDLITDNKENAEKLSAADMKATSEKDKIEKKISKLILANKENALTLSSAYKIINTQKKEIKKQAADLIRADKEKEKRKADLISAKKELMLAKEKAKHTAELIIVNKELTHQIEKRKQTELTLKESEQKSWSIMENSADAIFITNQQGKYVYTNKAVSAMLGYTSEEMKSKTIIDISPPKRIEEYLKFFKHILNEGKGFTEIELLKKDGNYISTDLNAVILPDGTIYGSCRDITSRKQAELELIEAKEKSEEIAGKLEAALESMSDAIFISDKEGKFINFNQAFATFHKFKTISECASTLKEYPEFLDVSYLDGEFVPLEMWVVSRALRGETGINKEYILKRKDIDESWVGSYNYSPIKSKHGEIIGSVVTARDISRSKQVEQELITAKEKAEESDRLKSAFLTNMSHEIRTPMNGILGFAELLKDPNISSDDQQDFIQTIQISGARMLSTINSIVDISKIESGLISIDIKETNLNEKIEFTYKFFKPEVESKGLQFSYKNGLPTNEASIKTDNEKIYGILTNLVRNALKFTYDGSIDFGYEKKGEYLEFFVKDTGVGIPQKQQQIIFERFRQGSESHNRGYEGSGLGLSISKSYVEMLGGRIWVESEEGLGSTFYFTIPYIAVSEDETEITDVVSTENKEVELKNLKILIVEDDEISYSLLSRTLQKISKEVLHAITGVQAIEACRNNPDLDLVLMDIRMPQMDGLEATRQIRQFNKDVIIIAHTAYAFTGDSEKAIEAGCNDYISKPVNKTLLYELIKKHLND